MGALRGLPPQGGSGVSSRRKRRDSRVGGVAPSLAFDAESGLFDAFGKFEQNFDDGRVGCSPCGCFGIAPNFERFYLAGGARLHEYSGCRAGEGRPEHGVVFDLLFV